MIYLTKVEMAENNKSQGEAGAFRGENLGVALKIFPEGEQEGKVYPRYILELDKDRVYVKTDKPLAQGTKIRIVIDDPRLEEAVEFSGEVVRVNPGPAKPGGLEPGMGIIFEPVSIADRARLSKFFQELEREDRTEEYLRFLAWVRRITKPLDAEEREKVKRDLLRALYGEERRPLTTQKKRREDLELISQVPLFQELDPLEIGELAEICLKERFEDGEIIFNEGDPGDKLYIILKGEVEIFKELEQGKEEILARLRPGEYFGEMSLIDNAPRSAGARAKGEVVALTISKPDFEILLKASDSFASKIYKFFVKTLSQRLRNTNEKIKRILEVLGKGEIT